MSTRGLSHLVVDVTDLDSAEAFYRNLLGFETQGRDLWPDCGANAVLAAGNQFLILAQNGDKPDMADTGVHQAYRISAQDRDAVCHRLKEVGIEVHRYREGRLAEQNDNFYVFDPSGNRVQLVANTSDSNGGGVTGIDHACVQDFDLEWSEYFYAGTLGFAIDHISGIRTDDYLRAREWGDENLEMAPGACRWVRYYRQIPGQNRMQARPNLQMFFSDGDGSIGVYMAMEDYAEPPEEQLIGTPRIAFRVDDRALDSVARALTDAGRPIQGPVTHGKNTPVTRSIYCKDTGGNFLEFSVRPGAG